MKNTILLILFLAVPLFAQQADDIYYPLKVGDRWTYSMSDAEVTEEVREPVTVEGVSTENAYALRETVRFGGVPSTIEDRLIDKRKTTILEIGKCLVQTLDEPSNSGWTYYSDVLLQFPLKVGKAWKYNSNGNVVGCTVVGLIDLKVEAGQFSNVVRIKKVTYEKRGKKLKAIAPMEFDYYAPNVGLIKVEMFDPKNPQSNLTEELTDYQVQ